MVRPRAPRRLLSLEQKIAVIEAIEKFVFSVFKCRFSARCYGFPNTVWQMDRVAEGFKISRSHIYQIFRKRDSLRQLFEEVSRSRSRFCRKRKTSIVSEVAEAWSSSSSCRSSMPSKGSALPQIYLLQLPPEQAQAAARRRREAVWGLRGASPFHLHEPSRSLGGIRT